MSREFESRCPYTIYILKRKEIMNTSLLQEFIDFINESTDDELFEDRLLSDRYTSDEIEQFAVALARKLVDNNIDS